MAFGLGCLAHGVVGGKVGAWGGVATCAGAWHLGSGVLGDPLGGGSRGFAWSIRILEPVAGSALGPSRAP